MSIDVTKYVNIINYSQQYLELIKTLSLFYIFCWKFADLTLFFSFTRQNMRVRKIGCASYIFRVRAFIVNRARNLFKPAYIFMFSLYSSKNRPIFDRKISFSIGKVGPSCQLPYLCKFMGLELWKTASSA